MGFSNSDAEVLSYPLRTAGMWIEGARRGEAASSPHHESCGPALDTRELEMIMLHAWQWVFV